MLVDRIDMYGYNIDVLRSFVLRRYNLVSSFEISSIKGIKLIGSFCGYNLEKSGSVLRFLKFVSRLTRSSVKLKFKTRGYREKDLFSGYSYVQSCDISIFLNYFFYYLIPSMKSRGIPYNLYMNNEGNLILNLSDFTAFDRFKGEDFYKLNTGFSIIFYWEGLVTEPTLLMLRNLGCVI